MIFPMLIAALRRNLKMECSSILIAKMSFTVWLTTELYTTLKVAVLEVLCNISAWICNGVLTNR